MKKTHVIHSNTIKKVMMSFKLVAFIALPMLMSYGKTSYLALLSFSY